MPIPIAAIVPNSPLLLLGIAPAVKVQVQRSADATQVVGHLFHARQVDVLVLIATVEALRLPGPCLFQAPVWHAPFVEVGDVSTTLKRSGSVNLTHRLKEQWETRFPLRLITTPTLPLEFAVSLVALGASVVDVPVTCLHVSADLGLDQVQQLIRLLRESFTEFQERIGLIAVGTLGQYTSTKENIAHVYDQAYVSAVTSGIPERVFNLDRNLATSARDALWTPTALLWGCIGDRIKHVAPAVYEAPVGVGLFTAGLELT